MGVAEDLVRFVKQPDNVPNARWFLRKIEWVLVPTSSSFVRVEEQAPQS